MMLDALIACYIRNRQETERGTGSWFTKPKVKINHITFIHPVTNIKFLATAITSRLGLCGAEPGQKCWIRPDKVWTAHYNIIPSGIILMYLGPALKISPDADLWYPIPMQPFCFICAGHRQYAYDTGFRFHCKKNYSCLQSGDDIIMAVRHLPLGPRPQQHLIFSTTSGLNGMYTLEARHQWEYEQVGRAAWILGGLALVQYLCKSKLFTWAYW